MVHFGVHLDDGGIAAVRHAADAGLRSGLLGGCWTGRSLSPTVGRYPQPSVGRSISPISRIWQSLSHDRWSLSLSDGESGSTRGNVYSKNTRTSTTPLVHLNHPPSVCDRSGLGNLLRLRVRRVVLTKPQSSPQNPLHKFLEIGVSEGICGTVTGSGGGVVTHATVVEVRNRP